MSGLEIHTVLVMVLVMEVVVRVGCGCSGIAPNTG